MNGNRIPAVLKLGPNRVWRTYLGGKTLDTLEQKPDPEDSHFPEDWIASTTRAVNPGRENPEEGITSIGLNGKVFSLIELIESNPEDLVGPEHFRKYGASTQFLLKFLDSVIRLHIQAHPTIQFAQERLNSRSGKTEAYIILGIRDGIPEPYILMGFQNPLPREEFREAVITQNSTKILSCFDKIRVKPGDVFIVPGGLPHAIGEGIFMIEIMEPTDFVVRLEFERGGYVLPEQARFMGRDIEFALDMIDFSQKSVDEILENYFCGPRLLDRSDGGAEYSLIDSTHTSCFSVSRLELSGRFVKKTSAFCVGIVTRGSGWLEAGGCRLGLGRGDRFFKPFRTDEIVFITEERMEIVLVFPPR